MELKCVCVCLSVCTCVCAYVRVCMYVCKMVYIRLCMKPACHPLLISQVPAHKFHELRYNVTSVLKEMQELEKRNILKMKN